MKGYSTVRSLFAFGLCIALTGACHPEDNKSDNSQALEIQSLDRRIHTEVSSSNDYISELEESLQTVHATAIDHNFDEYKSCSESGRNRSEVAAVRICADNFESNLKAILKTVVEDYRSRNANLFEALNEQVLALSEKGTAIGEDLEKVQKTYKTCQEDSLSKDFQDDSIRVLRVCEMTVAAEIVRIDTRVKLIDVNPLDTW